MIKWLVRPHGVVVSLAVDSANDFGKMAFSVVHDRPDMIDRLKAELLGMRQMRYGSINDSWLIDGLNLRYVMMAQSANFRGELIQGAEIYESYKSPPLEPGIAY